MFTQTVQSKVYGDFVQCDEESSVLLVVSNWFTTLLQSVSHLLRHHAPPPSHSVMGFTQPTSSGILHRLCCVSVCPVRKSVL